VGSNPITSTTNPLDRKLQLLFRLGEDPRSLPHIACFQYLLMKCGLSLRQAVRLIGIDHAYRGRSVPG
jgi:hypothetical protein